MKGSWWYNEDVKENVTSENFLFPCEKIKKKEIKIQNQLKRNDRKNKIKIILKKS